MDAAFELVSLLVANFTVTRVLSDNGCVFEDNEAGHMGMSFRGLDGVWLFVEGVREGTQKEGRVGFAA